MGVKKEEIYHFQEGKIRIFDLELGLDLEEEADLPSLKGLDLIPQHLKNGLRLQIEKSFDQHVIQAHLEKDGVFHGQWSLFYEDGTLKAKVYYAEGHLHGPAFFYSQSGQLLSESWYIRGKKFGKVRQYYLSGAQYSVQRFVEDLREGLQEYFYENGNPKTKMHYVRGHQEGITKLYYSNRQLKREIHFKGDKKMGSDRFWNTSGVLIEECFFKDHTPYQHHRKWYDSGALKEEKVYLDSPKLFDIQRFSLDGKLIFKGKYNPKDHSYRSQIFNEKEEIVFNEKGIWDGNCVTQIEYDTK